VTSVDLARTCPNVHAELSTHTSRGHGWRGQTGIAAAGDRWPVLSDAALVELVALYQQGMTARSLSGGTAAQRRRRHSQIQAGEWAAEALCGSMFRLAQRICVEQSAGRRRDLDDLNSVAMTAVLDAARNFDPARHSSGFSPWAAGWVRKVVANQAAGSDTSLPSSWRKVGRTAWGVRRDFEQAHGRAPSGDELVAATRAVVVARTEAAARSRDPSLTDDQLAAAVHRTLSKYGLNAALDRLGVVMAAVQTGVSLQTPAGSDDGASQFGDLLPDRHADVEAAACLGEDNERSVAVVRAVVGTDTTLQAPTLAYLNLDPQDLGGGDVAGVTLRSVADAYDIDQALLRSAVRHARSRIGAPHAHFAHLAFEADTLLVEATTPSYASLAD
jgi:hypothetical protein